MNPMKVFMVLSCIVYSIIDNYVYINYLGCQSKKFSVIYSDKIFEDRGYNYLLSVGIPEFLMNLISFHGFTKDTNSTVILLCHTWFVEYYLAEGLFIIEQKSEKLSIVPNELKQIIHALDMHDSEYVMDFIQKFPMNQTL